MLTSGDIEFEPPQAKVWHLTNSICVLVAGDAATQTEILGDVQIVVQNRVALEADNWWNVHDVAELYRQYYLRARTARAEAEILTPLGLTLDRFIGEQGSMNGQFVVNLANQLQAYSLPAMQAIFVGTDKHGPISQPDKTAMVYSHIYVANGAEITCHDSIGFAAIGIGQFHAESQLMFAKHVRRRPFPETLFLIYSAKKRSEVAPGVGEDTDMFTIGPGLGSRRLLGPEVMIELERIYQDGQRETQAVNKNCESGIRVFVEGLEAPLKPQAAPPTNPAEQPTPEPTIHEN